MGGEAVQAGLPLGRKEGSGGVRRQATGGARRVKKGMPEVVVVEDSMDIGAEHSPVRADGAIRDDTRSIRRALFRQRVWSHPRTSSLQRGFRTREKCIPARVSNDFRPQNTPACQAGNLLGLKRSTREAGPAPGGRTARRRSRCLAGRRFRPPASGTRRRFRRTAAALRVAARGRDQSARVQPLRSMRVCLVPGRITQVGVERNSRARSTKASATEGSAARASKSVKLDM